MSTAPPLATPAPATAVRALACPNCGGAIALRAAGLSVSLICPHCGSTLDATQGDLKLLVAAQEALKKPLIPLGMRGRMTDVEWEAIGYMERSSEDGGWSEYLLFNPYVGYRWLIRADGGFSIGRVLDSAPFVHDDCVSVDSVRFDPVEDPYPARVDFVVGEFPWRVRVGETVSVADYEQNSTLSLSREENGAERTWTLTAKQGYGVVEQAFGIKPDAVSGWRGASPFGPYVKPLWKMAAVAIIILLVAMKASGPAGDPLVRQDVALTLDAPEQTVVMGPITIDRPRSAVTVHSVTSRLDNGWVDLDYSLVDRSTQARYDAYGVAEEYHGRDSDGWWHEGNTEPTTRFAGIPRGSYDLVLDVSAHHWTGATVPPRDYTATDTAASPRLTTEAEGSTSSFSFEVTYGTPNAAKPATPSPPVQAQPTLRVTARRGATFEGNFWLAALLVALWPVYALYRHIRFVARPSGAGEE